MAAFKSRCWQMPSLEQTLESVLNDDDIRDTAAWSRVLREAEQLLNRIRVFSPLALSPLPRFIELYYDKLVNTTIAHASRKGISIQESREFVAKRARVRLPPVPLKAAAKNAAADLIVRVPASWIVGPRGARPNAESAALPLDTVASPSTGGGRGAGGGGGGGAPAAPPVNFAAVAPLRACSTSQLQPAIKTPTVSSSATAPLPAPSTPPLQPIMETPPVSFVAAAPMPASSKSPLQAAIETNQKEWGSEIEVGWAKVVATLPSAASVLANTITGRMTTASKSSREIAGPLFPPGQPRRVPIGAALPAVSATILGSDYRRKARDRAEAKIFCRVASLPPVELSGRGRVASAAGSASAPPTHRTIRTVPIPLGSSAPFVTTATAAAAAAAISSTTWTAGPATSRSSGSIRGAPSTSAHEGAQKRGRSVGSSSDRSSMPPPAAVSRWCSGPAPSTAPFPPALSVADGSDPSPSKKRRWYPVPASAGLEVGPRMAAGAAWPPPPPPPPPPGRAGEAGAAGVRDSWAAGAGGPRVASGGAIPGMFFLPKQLLPIVGVAGGAGEGGGRVRTIRS